MKIYIDTNTFPAAPGVYADAVKATPLPRVIPLVQGFRGTMSVHFLGDLLPEKGSAVTLAMRPYGARADVLRTAPVTVAENAEGGMSAEVNLAVCTDALAAVFGSRETLNLICGIIVTDDAAAFPTRVEWQLVLSVSATALGNGVPPDVTPTTAESIRKEIAGVKTDLAENYVTRNSRQTITGIKHFTGGILVEDGATVTVLGGGDGSVATHLDSGAVWARSGNFSGLRHCPGGVHPGFDLAFPWASGTLALTSQIPNLQALFTKHDGANIDVGKARTFVTAAVDGGYFSGFQLSDFASRIFAVSPGGAMNGFMAQAADGKATNRVFGAPLQLAEPAVNDDEAPTLKQVSALIDGKANKTDTVFGDGAENLFGDAVAIGKNAKARAGSIAIGENASVTDGMSDTSNFRGVALGRNANASEYFATALGFLANASGNSATAIGPSANASKDSSTALGNSAIAVGSYATALGAYANVSGTSAIALGAYADASGNSTALGSNANAGFEGIAIGHNAKANQAAIAIGNYSQSLAEGTLRGDTGGSVVIGRNAITTGQNSALLCTEGAIAALPNSTTISADNPEEGTSFRIVSVAGNGTTSGISPSYLIFQFEDKLNQNGEGIIILASQFFGMLKEFGGVEYNTTSEQEAGGGYGSSY